MPEPIQSEKRSRGNRSHKNPDCRCPGCTARRRKAEALALAIREGNESLATPTKGKKVIGSRQTGEKKLINAEDPIEIPLEWYKPSTDGHSMRIRIGQWLALRAKDPDISNSECARQMGIHRTTLNVHIQNAVREGILKFNDPLSRIDHEIIPKTLDNLSSFLDERDKTVTVEVAKGTIFKAYQESKGISQVPKTILAIKIEALPGVTDGTKVVGGHIVGKPREVADESVIDIRAVELDTPASAE